MFEFLAESVPSLEQAKVQLTDQLWMQPGGWVITFCLVVVSGFCIMLLRREFNRATRTENRLQVAETTEQATLTDIKASLKNIENWMMKVWEKLMERDKG